MDYPVDVWVEILLRVPFENLIELKRVCKCWHELIHNRNFIEMHRCLHFTRFIRFVYSRNVFQAPTSRLYDLSFDFDDRNDDYVRVRVSRLPPIVDGLQFYFRLHDSFDGLLLISPRYSDRFIIYNPVTRSCEFLPAVDRAMTPGVYWDWKIFRDAKTDSYTVIGLITKFLEPENTSSPSDAAKCLVLELHGCNRDHSASSWKELVLPRNMIGKIEARGMRKNGKICWLLTRFLGKIFKHSVIRLHRTSLLTFEPGKQQFRMKRCSPMPINGYWTVWERFFEYGSTFYRLLAQPCYRFEIWSLRYIDRRRPWWVKIHVIGNKPLLTTFPDSLFQPLAVVGGSNKLIIVSWSGSKIAVYDLVSREWTFPDIELDGDEESESELERAYALFPIK